MYYYKNSSNLTYIVILLGIGFNFTCVEIISMALHNF